MHNLIMSYALLLILFSCNRVIISEDAKRDNNIMSNEKHMYTNQLINETSPYLLQHAHNPVNWYAWGDEALNKAKNEDKLILVSIGYSACHWCHVMERESFESEEIAKIMNANFVCIKVDREERPDIDQVYMSAVQLMTGSGGWPLNCFVLPNGDPVYGGTYFRPEQWREVLANLSDTYINDKERILDYAEKIKQGIKDSELITIKSEMEDVNFSELVKYVNENKKTFDAKNGGTGSAPKFPLPNTYLFLLDYYYYSKDESILKQVLLTLDKMASGGIYDHVGGGFSRYSVDQFWHVPHFEKMLYDNAQLVSLYSAAYKLTKKELYKNVVTETLDFIDKELTSNDGGFYSSLDADSEGVEGKYYVWKKDEVDDILDHNSDIFCKYYNVTEKGNWESGENILFVKENITEFALTHGLTEDELMSILNESKEKLSKERDKRIRPGLDDKILTSWNTLMLKGYIDAYNAFEEKAYLKTALVNAQFILDNMLSMNGSLKRNHKNGKSTISAFLDDYSFTIEAFIELYQVTFNKDWLDHANQLINYVNKHFWDNETEMYYYTSDMDAELSVRKKEIMDNVIPSSNSSLAKSLFYLGKYFLNDIYLQRSKQMIINVKPFMERGGFYFSNWAIIMNYITYDFYEIAILGKESIEYKSEIQREFLPCIILAGSEDDENLELLKNRLIKGQTTIYVCEEKVCKLPVESSGEALKLIAPKPIK